MNKTLVSILMMLIATSSISQNWEYIGSQNYTFYGGENPVVRIHPGSYNPYVLNKNATTKKPNLHYFNSSSSSWTLAGTSGYQGIVQNALDMDFHPTTQHAYVAFQDSLEGGKLSVMEHNGSSWILIGSAGFSDGVAEYASIRIDPVTEDPYVAFTDGNYNNTTRVMRYNGTNWVNVSSQLVSPGNSKNCLLRFYPGASANPMPVIMFEDLTANSQLKCMYHNASSNAWLSFGGSNISNNNSILFDFVFRPNNDRLYVVFYDGLNQSLEVKFKNAAIWTLTDTAVTDGSCFDADIAYDTVNDVIRYAYADTLSNLVVREKYYGIPGWSNVGLNINNASVGHLSLIHQWNGAATIAFVDKSTIDNKISCMELLPCVPPTQPNFYLEETDVSLTGGWLLDITNDPLNPANIMNTGDQYVIYENGCYGNALDTLYNTNSSWWVNPQDTTTYYVGMIGYCADQYYGLCDSIVLNVDPCVEPSTPILNVPNEISIQQNESVTIGVFTDSTTIISEYDMYVIYSDSCGGTPIDTIGQSISESFVVYPSDTTTYFVGVVGVCASQYPTQCDSVVVNVEIQASIKPKGGHDEFIVFPNPSNGIVNIKFSNGLLGTQYEIYNQYGQRIMKEEIYGIQQQLKIENTGMYSIKLLDYNGKNLGSNSFFIIK